MPGTPEAGGQFTWSGPALSNGHTQHNTADSTTSSSLTINDVGSEDGGQYECSYSGLQTITATLTVGGRFKFKFKISFLHASLTT